MRKYRDTPELLKKIGENIRRFRRQRKWTQLDLAVITDSHKTQISRIERGEHNVGVCTLEKIAIALEVDIEELLSEE